MEIGRQKNNHCLLEGKERKRSKVRVCGVGRDLNTLVVQTKNRLRYMQMMRRCE
jgi:hypothetical protein